MVLKIEIKVGFGFKVGVKDYWFIYYILDYRILDIDIFVVFCMIL